MVRRTQQEFREELVQRFGTDWRDWAFVCPHCGDVATGGDFDRELRVAGLAVDGERSGAERYLGQQCIGRVMGALSMSAEHWDKTAGKRGCDWCAFGLFRGPDVVVLPDGTEIYSFKMADVMLTDESKGEGEGANG